MGLTLFSQTVLILHITSRLGKSIQLQAEAHRKIAHGGAAAVAANDGRWAQLFSEREKKERYGRPKNYYLLRLYGQYFI